MTFLIQRALKEADAVANGMRLLLDKPVQSMSLQELTQLKQQAEFLSASCSEVVVRLGVKKEFAATCADKETEIGRCKA